MEKAVVYARYSSSGQTEQSIEGQLAAAYEYAEKKGYEIVEEYCDRAKTGTNDNREQFQRMLKDCAKKQFSVIIVWKVDRFGRNREEITFNKYKAKKQGVRVEYVAENIAQGPEGVILESVLEGMAEYYSLQLSQNVKRGNLESAKKHRVIGNSAPYGYKAGPNKEYLIDEERSEVVKKIFSWYADGYVLTDIQKMLEEQGLMDRKYSLTMLGKILKNEKYKGIYIFKDVIRDEGAIPRIIDDELFDKVQAMMKKNRRQPRNKWTYTDYALTNKLFCGECGSPMVGMSGHNKQGRKYHYYLCLNKHHGKGCNKKNIKKEVIEEAVLSGVHSLLSDDAVIEQIIDMVWAYYEETDDAKKEIQVLTRTKTDIGSKIANITRSVEEGMPYEIVKGRLAELQEQLDNTNREIANISLKRPLQLTRDHIEYYLQQYRIYRLEDRESQRRMLSTFVNSVHLYEDRILIALNYSGDDRLIELDESYITNPVTLKESRSNTGFISVLEHVILFYRKI